MTLPEFPQEFDQICSAIKSGCSVLVLGEAGAGAGNLALSVADQFSGAMACAIATYKGSGKLFFQAIATQLDIPIENEDGKPLTMEQLKDEIAQNVTDETLLVLPEAKRLPASVRYWLEDLMAGGVRLLATAVVNPQRDVFLDMVEVELPLANDQAIRLAMQAEAERHGLALSDSKLAELQPLAGRNPAIAKKVIRNEAFGLKQHRPEHSQYLDISPLILAAICTLGVLRFVGVGTGNKTLYVVGGIAVMVGLSFKYLGRMSGAKRRYGQ